MKFWMLCLALSAPLWSQKFDPPFKLPDNVEMKADLVYASPGGHDLHLDLFHPRIGAGPFPAIVYVHGGGFKKGDKSAFVRQAAYMASKGFVAVTIEYRLSGVAKYPAAVYDCKTAVRWLRTHAAEYHVAPDKIGAAGGSAGGHLVAMLGTTNDDPKFEGPGAGGVSSRVVAVAALNPAVDFVSTGKSGKADSNENLRQFLGCTFAENPKLWADASPITHASKKSAAFLFVHGTGDTMVPFQQSVDMLNKLKTAGASAEIFPAEGANHGFFQKPPFYQPVLQRVDEFFEKWLR
jgi:acetyl esterase/lipase